MALDESTENDLVQEVEGLQFIVSKMIHQIYQGFTIESVKAGSQTMLRITPSVPDEGGGCSSCTTCG